jgi:aspartate racemase
MIGILAGMGPKSTGPFVDQVVSAFQRLTGAKNDIDFPPMMIYSLPTPFYVDRPIDHTLMEKTICAGLHKLEDCGVSFIAMPCNTAHLYFSQLQQCIGIPLLNIVTATLDRLPESIGKITILGTRPTIESGIYQKGLEHAHLKLVLESSWQKKIDDLILSIKSAASFKKSAQLWEELAKDLQKAGVDTVVLACTDLNVVLQSTSPPLKIVDSSLCLAEEIVKKWEELR